MQMTNKKKLNKIRIEPHRTQPLPKENTFIDYQTIRRHSNDMNKQKNMVVIDWIPYSVTFRAKACGAQNVSIVIEISCWKAVT